MLRMMLVGLFYLLFSLSLHSVSLKSLIENEDVCLLEKSVFGGIWILNLSHKNLDDIDGIDQLIVRFSENGNGFLITAINNLCLQLDNNNLKKLPLCIEKLRLFGLSVSNNKLNGLPLLPPSLRSLNISNNCFQSSNFWFLRTLKNLEWLYLEGNNLENIPNSIQFCKNLKALHASHNAIKTINPSIFKLDKLKAIFLASNLLSGLPIEIYSMELTNLDLADNRFEKAPQWLDESRKNIPNHLTILEVDEEPILLEDVEISDTIEHLQGHNMLENNLALERNLYEMPQMVEDDAWSIESDEETLEYS